MRLEYALSIGEPRSAMIQAIQSRSTGPSHLTQADVLGALQTHFCHSENKES
mgnify:CR=1 FL=1